jgi:hypothetical protein
LYALQRLEQGELQQLGDRLLPWKFDALTDLKPHGLTAEGKTRKGVPDSFVGPAAEHCTVAVEYTSQDERLIKKLEDDYKGVRARCRLVREIFLCTNRVVASDTREHLERLGHADGVDLTIFDGVDLADALFSDRQDLRLDHLGIPVGAHSRWTLLPAMQTRLEESLPSRIKAALQRRALPHDTASGRLHLLGADPRTTAILAVGKAGTGKSVWSAREALSRVEGQPAFWLPAKDLRLATADPISVALVRAAFGTTDASRALDLANLLGRERLRILLAIDGIDEVKDFAELLLALKEFRTAALGTHTLMLLTCREEALPYLEDGLGSWRPEVLDSRKGTLISLGALSKYEIFDFLRAVSVVTKSEGSRIEIAAGRSEGPVVGEGVAKPPLEGTAVAAEGGPEVCGSLQDVAGSLAEVRITVWVDVEPRVFESQSPIESEQCGMGEVDDESFGSDQQPMQLPARHRFRAPATAFGLGAWAAKTSRNNFSSSRASSRSAATASSSSARFMSTR